MLIVMMMKKGKTLKPLVTRIFKLKNPTLNFFCPLCRTSRSLQYSSQTNALHFVQLFIATLVTAPFLIKQWDWRVPFIFLLVFMTFWSLFELVRKTLFRQEIPCPHCGLDATWYRKDVRVAQKLVKEFWQKKSEIPPSAENTERPPN